MFLSKWFLGAPLEQIRRDNVKEFFAWSMINVKYEDVKEEDMPEVDYYADHIGEKLQTKLKPGSGQARSLRGTLDAVSMQHRPLLWYLIIFAVDNISSARLLYHGFQFYGLPLAKSVLMFPVRPVSIFSWKRSPARKTTYWYRKHTSKKRLPIVVIQGIGVGLYAYVDFLAALSGHGDASNDDGEMGIIVVEIMEISARICSAAPSTTEMRSDIKKILDAHGWDEVVLVGHSYGTAIAANVLRDPALAKRMKAVMLMDPICFLLHLPDVAYNFTRRKPVRANEHMLSYFSSQDMMISHTLARHFFWSEYILWLEDIAELNIPLTVTLSGQDLIVPVGAVWQYLTDPAGSDVSRPNTGQTPVGDAEYEEGNLRVIWFNDFDHAGLFNSKGARRGAARNAREYCTRYFTTSIAY